MADSLNDILARRNIDEPAEIRIVKDYIKRHFDMKVGVALRDKQLVIKVPNAAAAGALRMHLYDLEQSCGLEKKPVIRIA
jgi:hypothetical protein